MSFDRAFEHVIAVEGGLVEHPADPGGLTKYGISQRSYPGEDVRNLTLSRAKELYRRDFWDRVRGDELPPAVAICLFDYAVNSGVSQAIRTFQRCLGVVADGVFGPATLAAARAREPRSLVIDLQAERLLFLSRLVTWDDFGRGWTRRVISTALEALA